MNYRPITCLPLMWKLLTGILGDEIYQHLEERNLFPDEQKGCRRRSRGTKDQLMIDKMVLRNCKRRMTNLCVAWIDYIFSFHFHFKFFIHNNPSANKYEKRN